MPCKYCGDSHSAFDPCQEAIEALGGEQKQEDAAQKPIFDCPDCGALMHEKKCEWKDAAQEGVVTVPREPQASSHYYPCQEANNHPPTGICPGDMHEKHETPRTQSKVEKVKGAAAFLRSNYADLSEAEMQVIERHLHDYAAMLDAAQGVVTVPREPTDAEMLRFWNGETNHSNKKKILAFGLQMFRVGRAALSGKGGEG